MRQVGIRERTAPQLRPNDHVAWSDSGSVGFARVVQHAVANAADDVEVMVVARLDEPGWDPSPMLPDEIAAGSVQVRDADAMYRAVLSPEASLEAQVLAFSSELDDVLARGRSSLLVIADNTPMLTGSTADFERWLEWEQLVDQWQAGSPITGVCYFDSSVVDARRLSAVDAVHPASVGSACREWRLFHDKIDAASPRLSLAGSVDAWDVPEAASRIIRHLDNTPSLERALDLGKAHYVHHRLLIELRKSGVATFRTQGLVERLAQIVDGLS